MESRLVQAVGRARLVRENATVHLFSKYPLIGFEQKHLNDMDTPGTIMDISIPDQASGQVITMNLTSGSMAS